MAGSDRSGFGALLRQRRAAVGMTQEELAEAAGISTRAVSDMERGLRTRVYVDTARRVATALRLDGTEREAFEAAARGQARAGTDAGGTPREEPGTYPAGELPVPPTRLIGRDDELAMIVRALRSPDVRVVTLVGPGGVGKTRLAIEAARLTAGEFPDGVSFVALSGVRDPSVVASTVARSLGVHAADEPAENALRRHLKTRRLLLVLDTFEHLLAAAGLVAGLAAASHGLTTLVTSRTALRLRGEQQVPVGPLPVPTDPVADEVHVMAYPATRLFIERVRAVDPTFAVGAPEVGLVVDICRRLEGLPLALELAAARTKHLPLATLRDELDRRLGLLTGGPRDLPVRQRTMRDTIGWSYALLGEPQRTFLRSLSTFAGGWTLEAATVVCSLSAAEVTLSLTSTLVDDSLIFMTDAGVGEPRYTMLDVIHEFAAGIRDDRHETSALARRHAEYFAALAEAAEPELGGAGQSPWFARLEADHDNLRSALRWALDEGEGELAQRLAGALWQFWRRRGDFDEGRRWLEQALAVGGTTPPTRQKALWGLAWLAYSQAGYDVAARAGEEILALAERSGDRLAIRHGMTIRGMVALAGGSPDRALRPFRTALEIAREMGPSWVLATSVLNLGLATLHVEETRDAEALFDEALALYRQLGDRIFAARTTMYLGHAALSRGDTERSRALMVESLRTFWEAGERYGIPEALEALSAVEASAGRAEEAARIAGAAAALRTSLGARPMPFDRRVAERHLEAARAALGDRAWATAWADGRTMGPAAAIERAVATGPSSR